jgi:hypothetical protein
VKCLAKYPVVNFTLVRTFWGKPRDLSYTGLQRSLKLNERYHRLGFERRFVSGPTTLSGATFVCLGASLACSAVRLDLKPYFSDSNRFARHFLFMVVLLVAHRAMIGPFAAAQVTSIVSALLRPGQGRRKIWNVIHPWYRQASMIMSSIRVSQR